MIPRVLVLYYSQTGQLRNILDSVLSQVKGSMDLSFAMIEPEHSWPWPWTAGQFFDAMPESVLQRPAPVKPLPPHIVNRDYDLIILGWQPWFLHPSQPTMAFLQSPDARILNGKPVVTVVGARNMWLNAGEIVKEGLRANAARHIGNIVLVDTNTNLISLLTVIRWSFKGRRDASGWLPQAGVQDDDIAAAARFGQAILDAGKSVVANKTQRELPAGATILHEKLLRMGAVELHPGLVLLEQRGVKNFRFWAKYIRENGGPGAAKRQGRVRMFKRLLLTAIFILSPLSALTAAINERIQRKRLQDDVVYFRNLKLEPGRI
jgi:hypothetical protein